MMKKLLSFFGLLAVIVSAFMAFSSLSAANTSNVVKLGDVNADGSVNVADITVLVNYLKTPSATQISKGAADANHDGSITAADEAAIANIIMSGTPDKSATSVLFFTEASLEKPFGEAVTNALVYAGSTGAVSYSASPASVVTVNATTGELTYVGTGQATITATLAASGNYSAATAQYTLTVVKNTSNTDPDETMTTEPEANKTEGGDDLSYTGGEQPLITPGESSGGTIHYKVTTTPDKPSKDDDGWTTEVPTGTDAGTYYVWYYTEGNGNFDETEVCDTPVTVTIDKGDGSTIDPAQTMTTPITAKTTEGSGGSGDSGNQSYTGDPLPLVNPGESSAGTIHYKVTTTNEKPSKDDDGWTTDVPTATDAGTYYVWYYAEGNDNCDETDICDTPVTVTIDKAEGSTTDPATTMTTPIAAKTGEGGGNPTYTGSEQPLVTPGASAAGTLKYKVTTSNEAPSKDDDGWTTDVPTAIDAGTYYVWYYAEGNDNYEETAVSGTPIEVTIGKASATTDPATTMTTAPAAKKTEGGGTPTYTGSAQPLITAGESLAGTLKYQVTTTNTQPSKSEGTWSTEVPTATDAGTYYVWYYAEGNDNYSETAVSGTPITATIDKAAATTDPATTLTTAPAANNPEGGLTYTGNPLNLITAGTSKAGTLKYKATTTNEAPAKDNTWSTEVPTGTVAGTYYVWYYAEGNDNYNETAVCGTPIEVTIGNATMAGGVTATPYNGYYDGAAHGITVTAPDGATIKYRETAEGDYNLTENPTYTDVAAEARVVYFQVTQPSFDAVTGSAMVTINKVVLTATADDKTRDYGAANPELTVSVTGFVNNETAATASGYTAPTAATEATAESAVGTHDITASGGSATNYTFSYTKGTLTITPIDVTVTAPTAVSSALTYSGSAQNLFNVGSTNDGTLMYKVTTTDTKPTSKDGFSESIAQQTAAGTYYLWYYVDGDGNHNDSEINTTAISKEIGKKAPAASDFSYSVPASLVYDGSAKSATFAINEGTLGMGDITTVKYYKGAAEADPITVGTYTVKIAVSEGDNYLATTSELTDESWIFTITAAAAGVTAPTAVESVLTYDGTPKALFNAGSSDDGTLKYMVTTTDTKPTSKDGFSDDIATPTNAGTYYLWYYVAGDGNHSDSEINATAISKEIGKRAPAASDFTYTPPTSLVYDGSTKSATVVASEGISGMGAVTVKYYKGTVETTPVEGGIYTVKISVAAGDNYSATTADLTDAAWTFTIDKAIPPSTTITGFSNGGGDNNGTVTF